MDPLKEKEEINLILKEKQNESLEFFEDREEEEIFDFGEVFVH